MAVRRNKSDSVGEPGGPKPPPLPDPRILRQPPLADPAAGYWPLVIVLGAFALWLVWLAILMAHAERWSAG